MIYKCLCVTKKGEANNNNRTPLVPVWPGDCCVWLEQTDRNGQCDQQLWSTSGPTVCELYSALKEELTTSMQDFSTDFHNHSLLMQRSARLHSTDQKLIVQWITKFPTAQASSVPIIIRNRVFSYLARHRRSGQNSVISQALHHTQHWKPLQIHVVLHTQTPTALSFFTDRTHHPPSLHNSP
jgi:hypothetical protein